MFLWWSPALCSAGSAAAGLAAGGPGCLERRAAKPGGASRGASRRTRGGGVRGVFVPLCPRWRWVQSSAPSGWGGQSRTAVGQPSGGAVGLCCPPCCCRPGGQRGLLTEDSQPQWLACLGPTTAGEMRGTPRAGKRRHAGSSGGGPRAAHRTGIPALRLAGLGSLCARSEAFMVPVLGGLCRPGRPPDLCSGAHLASRRPVLRPLARRAVSFLLVPAQVPQGSGVRVTWHRRCPNFGWPQPVWTLDPCSGTLAT